LRRLDCRRLERIESAPIGRRCVRNLIVDLLKKSFGFLVADSDRTEIEVSERQGRILRERIPGL